MAVGPFLLLKKDRLPMPGAEDNKKRFKPD